MAEPRLVLCDAPCLTEAMDLRKLKAALGTDREIAVVPYLCGQNGIRKAADFLGEAEGLVLTGRCPAAGEILGLLEAQTGAPVTCLDVAKFPTETEAAAHVLFHLTTAVKRRAHRARKVTDDAVLVVGGGVAGVQAALDLAEAEKKVYLVERAVSIGGIMSQLDKTFPTLDCSICILGPKLADVGRNPAIELLTLAEIAAIRGHAGRFEVTLKLHPRYVDMSRCTGCGSCSEVCPVILPNPWDLNLKPRKCIHILFAQSIPLRASVDMAHCIRCQLCVQACEKDAINLDDTEKTRKIRVGAIVVTAGLDPFDAAKRAAYGYGRYENVFTNIDFERIVCASGPTGGDLVRPDGRPMKKIAFIQCVGSRDVRFNRYCSGYCCMASIKEAMLIKETVPDAEVTVFFNDIRAAGKGFEELYLRVLEHGVRFVKGLPSRIEEDPATKDLTLVFGEMVEGTPKAAETFDFVILATGVEPDAEAAALAETLGAERDAAGFLTERHPTRGAIETTAPGIFMAGGIQGPKDIPESVAQASGAAARALAMLHRLKEEGNG